MKKKQLIYFVDDTEIPFILKDIIKCSEVFEKIYLFSIDTVDNKSEIPKNVVVFDDFMDWKSFSKKKILTGNWKKILGIYLFEIRKSGKLLPIKSAIARIVSNIFKAEQIQSRLLLNGITISEQPPTSVERTGIPKLMASIMLTGIPSASERLINKFT